MSINREVPEWGKRALKMLIDQNKSITELAEELGMTRQYISSVINGRVICSKVQNAICEHLKISA